VSVRSIVVVCFFLTCEDSGGDAGETGMCTCAAGTWSSV